jgi:hypothetical protein
MGFFNQILQKLGIRDAQAKPPAGTAAPATPGSAAPAGVPPAAPGAGGNVMDAPPGSVPPSAPAASSAAPAAPKAVPMVDVVAQMEFRAKENAQKLNWRTSIVDLLKLLDIDSSLSARKELATELGCPPELMGDSAKMNMWLHKTVLARIAANGGNIPREMLD